MTHNHKKDHDQQDLSHHIIIQISKPSRRRLLGLLAALPPALGLGLLPRHEPAAAKKKGKRKHKKRKKGHGGGGGSGSSGGNYSPDSEERKFLDLINAHRREHGAGELRLNNQLGAAADFHSRDMAKKNYFKHTLSNGDSTEQNIRRFGYTNYRIVGENIAAGYEIAETAFAGWKKSSGHNKNMLDNAFDEIGIGRAHGKKGKYGWYWTTTFGGG